MGGGMGKASALQNSSQRPFSYANSEEVKETSLGGNMGSSSQWGKEEGVNDSSLWSDIKTEKSMFPCSDMQG